MGRYLSLAVKGSRDVVPGGLPPPTGFSRCSELREVKHRYLPDRRQLMLTSMFMSLLPLCFASGGNQDADLGEPSAPAVALYRLCDAAWTPQPERFDILLYRERQLKQLSREEVRTLVEEALEAASPGASSTATEHKELVEANIDNILKERNAPRRIIQRIVQDGERQRVGMVILRPEQEPSSARLSDWYFTLGSNTDSEGRNAMQVTGEFRIARILPGGMRFAGTPVEEWLSVPFKPVIQMMVGAVEEPGKVSLSQERLQDVLSGDSGVAIRVTRVKDPRYSSGPLERVEIVDVASGQVRVAILCDREDYGRTYEVVAQNHATGNPMQTFTRRGHLPNNVATELEMRTYDESGSLVESDRLFFLCVDFSPVFKPGEWELRVPPGYGLIDGRETPDEVLSVPEAQSAEIGDTIREVLAAARPESIVKQNLVRVGVPIPRGSDGNQE